MEENFIYVITAIHTVTDCRSFGWFFKPESAKEAVEKNAMDMNEAGYYNHIVVEKYGPGIHCQSLEQWWYVWQNGAFHSCEEPQWARQTVNWSLG